MSNKKRDSFVEFQELLVNPQCISWTFKQYADAVGVTEQTISKWRREKIEWSEINKKRRDQYGIHTPEVDLALIKKAKTGDLPSIKLYYEVFDGYVPTTAVKNTHDIDEADVDAELSALLKRAQDTRDAMKGSPDAEDRALAHEMAQAASDHEGMGENPAEGKFGSERGIPEAPSEGQE